jgi:serpin B
VSVSIALAMTYGGARGETAAEMAKVMHLPAGETLHGSWATALASWAAAGKDVEIALANRLFGEATYTFEKPFLGLTAERYGAPLEPRDFKNAHEAQRRAINQWVHERTRTRIDELIPAPGITAETRLVLANALYFKAPWADPFTEAATQPGSFWADGKTEVVVPLMTNTAGYGVASSAGVELLELPYHGARFAMLIALPTARDGLGAVEAALDGATLARWTAALAPERVWLTMPRFTLDPPKSIDLADALGAMGMKKAFEPRSADFTGIANPPNPDDRLFISAVFHKTFVAVDEKGTEAAAATAVLMAPSGAPPSMPPRKVVVDRPFLFFIRDRESGAVLFVGRVTNPTKKA